MACNLIENALKYGDFETSVRVTVTASEGSAMLEVANTGLDIPLELQSRLFERFARAPDSAARADGVGLGLAFVHTVAGRHGGKVVCRSVGGTTAFRVSLPLAPDRP
jgi:signal transduction histidine kinase